MKIALFVAGDENIFFPALVALNSIEDHNPDVFDLYLCFDKAKLTLHMSKTLDRYKINFIDSALLAIDCHLNSLPLMKEGRWPKEIFLNWALPEYFHGLGYRHSIKVDYDILCVGSYDIASILPGSNFLTGLLFDVAPEKENVSSHTLDYLIKEELYKPESKTYINAGFVVFDNNKAHNFSFFRKLVNTYSTLLTSSPNANLAEQLSVAFVISTCENGVHELDGKYNHRVRWGILVGDDLAPQVKNIHYITSVKPWKPFDRKLIRSFVNQRQGVIFAYRAIWLEKASKIEGFEIYCDERPLNQEQMLGINILICHNYNQRIYELEKKLKEINSLSCL